jgi:hypothetical protein
MDIWSIGPFQLKAELIISLISAAAGLAAIKIVHRKSSWHSAPVTDVVFNGLVIIFLFWKFGHVLSDPSLLWENSSLVVLASQLSADLVWAKRTYRKPVLTPDYLAMGPEQRTVRLFVFFDYRYDTGLVIFSDGEEQIGTYYIPKGDEYHDRQK